MDSFLLLGDDVLLQVRVYDDGLPVTELKTVFITLMPQRPIGSDDIFYDTAELIIVPQGKHLTVSCPSMHGRKLIIIGIAQYTQFDSLFPYRCMVQWNYYGSVSLQSPTETHGMYHPHMVRC